MEEHIPLLKPFFTGMLGVFGCLLGSFCNVVILRMASGQSVVFPPSACPHCHHRLSAADLIPVFGWILLGGKCRYCRAPISIQYPLVEAACGLTLASVFQVTAFSPLLIPQASWGVFMLVTAVLWVRGEVGSARPFLYPIAIRVPLELWAGTFDPKAWMLPLAVGLASAVLVSLRNPRAVLGPWFGCAVIGLLATRSFLWWFPGLLGAATLLQLAFPLPEERRLAAPNAILFVWCLAAMGLCAWQGHWGF